MEKINFKNGQAPYINDTNLNQLQENIEEAIDSKSSLPEGGSTGQVLAKASNKDNDVEWVNQTGGGEVTTVEDTLESESTINALSANQGKVLNEKINHINTYSTEEINTGKTWIDGKPMYRRIVSFTVSNDVKGVDLSGLNFEDGIIEWGRLTLDAGNNIKYIDMLPLSGSTYAWIQLIYSHSKWVVTLNTNSTNLNGFVCEICLLYTKTTD